MSRKYLTHAAALLATALVAGSSHAAEIIYSTTVSLSSHETRNYAPDELYVTVAVPNNTNGADAGAAWGAFAMSSDLMGQPHALGFPESLLKALNNPIYSRLTLAVGNSQQQGSKPDFSATVTSVGFTPLSMVVTHPNGGTDISTVTQFDFYNDPAVPEPSSIVLALICCLSLAALPKTNS